MKKQILFIILTIMILGLFSCKKVPLTNGPLVTETRQLSDFNTINIYNNIEIILIQSDATKIEISAGANLMENITTSVDNNALTIKNENQCNWIRSYDNPLSAKVYYKHIHNIEYESVGGLSNTFCQDTLYDDLTLHVADGSGDINLNIKCNSLNVNFSYGCSDIILQGTAKNACYSQGSFGPIHAQNLVVEKVTVTNRGSNDCYIHCTDNLNATIKSIGDIYYHGQPDSITLDVKPDARGSLIPF